MHCPPGCAPRVKASRQTAPGSLEHNHSVAQDNHLRPSLTPFKRTVRCFLVGTGTSRAPAHSLPERFRVPVVKEVKEKNVYP